jgi:hypothetical protein
VEQKQVDSVGRKYDSVTTAITTAFNTANGGGAAGGGGGGGRGRGFTPLPDTLQARIDSIRGVRNSELRKVLAPSQYKDFDAAVKAQLDAAAALRSGGGGDKFDRSRLVR